MPTFTPSFELDLETDLSIEFSAGTYVALGQGVYSEASMVLDMDADFPFEFSGANYVSPGSGVYSPKSVVLDLETDFPIEFAIGIGLTPAIGTFYPKTVEIGLGAVEYAPSDHAFEILFGAVIPSSFPGNLKVIEVQFPTKASPDSNRILFQVGTEEWRSTKDAAATVVQDVSVVRFLVETDSVAAFLSDLDTNRTAVFRLTLPGYFPFNVESSDNWVRVLGRNRPKREERGLVYAVEVTLLFVAIYS